MKKLSVLGAAALLLTCFNQAFAQNPPTAGGQLSALNNSGVTGTFTITASGDNEIMVKATFKGFKPNTAHAGHIHLGTCEKQGSVSFPLQSAKADASGNAMTESLVNHISFKEVTGDSFQFYINYHEADGPAGDGVTCGNITNAPAPIAAAPLAATATAATTGAGSGVAPSSAPAAGSGGSTAEGSFSFYLVSALAVVLAGSLAAFSLIRRKEQL